MLLALQTKFYSNYIRQNDHAFIQILTFSTALSVHRIQSIPDTYLVTLIDSDSSHKKEEQSRAIVQT